MLMGGFGGLCRAGDALLWIHCGVACGTRYTATSFSDTFCVSCFLPCFSVLTTSV